MNLDLLLEAERRGILPPDKATLLAEARKRGLVGGGKPPEMSAEVTAALEAAGRPNVVGALNSASVTDMLGAGALPAAPVSRGEAVARSALQGATFGGGDEGTAAVSGVLSMLSNPSVMDETLTDRYKAGYNSKLSEERERLAEGREKYKGASLMAELSGAIASPASVLAAPRIARATNLLGKIGTGAASGATSGAAYGFLSGEGDGRASSMTLPAVLGGVVGGAVPAVGAAVRGVSGALKNNKGLKKFIEDAPSVSELKGKAADLYKGGSSAPPGSMEKVVSSAAAKMKALGAMNPDGSFADEYAKLGSVFDTLTKYADEAMTPEQMQTVRREIAKVARLSGGQGKGARILLDEFDKITEPLHPGIKAGNEVYSRAKKLEDLLIDDTLASDAAQTNYTKAGYETSIRHKMRALLDRIEKGKETRFTPEQIAQIRRVAHGGRFENTARWISRSAPSSFGSMAINGGMPTVVGSAVGMPGLGAALGAGVPQA